MRGSDAKKEEFFLPRHDYENISRSARPSSSTSVSRQSSSEKSHLSFKCFSTPSEPGRWKNCYLSELRLRRNLHANKKFSEISTATSKSFNELFAEVEEDSKLTQAFASVFNRELLSFKAEIS
jgi:hypothetical protein